MSATYTQADLTSKKVNELKQILSDLKLTTTGVKADLIARILEVQNNGTSTTANTTTNTTESAPATDLPAAGNALGNIPAEDKLPSTTAAPGSAAPAAAAETKKPEESKPLADLPELPSGTNRKSELEKRAARLARFGGNPDELAKLQRAEKFGADNAKGLDDKTLSKLDSELSNKRLPKNGANGTAKKPAQNTNKAASTNSKPVSQGANKPASNNKRPPPIDTAEEERRKKRAERFGA